jgi:hypothetical protein
VTRPLRVEMEGGLFHVMSRGDGRERIFHADGDREMFLDILGIRSGLQTSNARVGMDGAFIFLPFRPMGEG